MSQADNYRPRSPKDYELIKVWGVYIGSFTYFIEEEQQAAYVAGVPIDAVYATPMREEPFRLLRDIDREATFRGLRRTAERLNCSERVFSILAERERALGIIPTG